MDGDYWQYAMRDKPKFNELVCSGYVTHSLQDAVQWLDRFIRSTSTSFPDCFKYKGIRVLGPFEQYKRNVFNKDATRQFELARTDCFLTELEFEFNDNGDIQTIYRELWIPFGRQGNRMRIYGSMATLHPVVADRLISVTMTGLFIIIQRAKFNLEKKEYTVVKDGEVFTGNFLESRLHNEGKVKPSETWGSPTTGHYLFAKYGPVEAFKHYYDTEVYICSREDLDPRYNPDEHYLFTAKDRVGRQRKQRDTNFALIVPREKFDKEPGLQILVISFFYATDYHNTSFRLEDIERPADWIKTLAYTSFQQKDNLATQIAKIEKHLESLEDYIDEMTMEIILDEGLVGVESIYDLLSFANDNVIDLMRSSNIGSMWGKYLMVKRYVLSSITFQIILLGWELRKSREALSLKIIKWTLGSKLHPTAFLGIVKGHGEKTNVQYPGDCMLFKHTLISVRQIDAVATPNGKSKINVDDPGYQFDPSILDSGSVVNFPKGEPDGRKKLNPFISIDEKGKIIPGPYHEMLLEVKDEMGFDN